MSESNHERSPATKRHPRSGEASTSLGRTGNRLIPRAKFSEEDQRIFVEVSEERLLNQIHSSAPDEVTIPSRLLRDD